MVPAVWIEQTTYRLQGGSNLISGLLKAFPESGDKP
jgi:hypothetical protein